MTRRVTGGIALPWNMAEDSKRKQENCAFLSMSQDRCMEHVGFHSSLWLRAMLETVKLVGVLAHRVACQSCSNSKSLAFPEVRQNQGFGGGL